MLELCGSIDVFYVYGTCYIRFQFTLFFLSGVFIYVNKTLPQKS